MLSPDLTPELVWRRSRLVLWSAYGLGLLLITHDLRILPGLVDRLVLVEQGRVVEELPSADLTLARSEMAQRLVRSTQRIAGGRLG